LTLPNFSLNWMKSGTMRNGQFSTVKTTEFHRTGKGCLLLDKNGTEMAEVLFSL